MTDTFAVAQFHTSAIRLPQEWEWDIMRRYAETAVKSKLVGTEKNPVTAEQALFLILKGYELGITPLQSLAEIHLINGKPGLSVQLMIGLANRSGMLLHLDMPDATDAYAAKKATVTGVRRDRPDSPVSMTFSMDDAKAANLLGNPIWQRYPGQMLVNRAMSMVLRRLIPEALSGMYLAEELENTADNTPSTMPQEAQPQLPASSQQSNAQNAAKREITAQTPTQAAPLNGAPTWWKPLITSLGAHLDNATFKAFAGAVKVLKDEGVISVEMEQEQVAALIQANLPTYFILNSTQEGAWLPFLSWSKDVLGLDERGVMQALSPLLLNGVFNGARDVAMAHVLAASAEYEADAIKQIGADLKLHPDNVIAEALLIVRPAAVTIVGA